MGEQNASLVSIIIALSGFGSTISEPSSMVNSTMGTDNKGGTKKGSSVEGVGG